MCIETAENIVAFIAVIAFIVILTARMSMISLILLLLIATSHSAHGLDNGLALTPPMGWISWVRIGCSTNCTLFPNDCVNENLYKQAADAMVSEGFKDVGYQYINIDDCWSEWERDPVSKRVVPDGQRFPSGIKALSDYIHSKGLKFGIYSDMGTKTCEGYPGHLPSDSPRGKKGNYFALDAQTFAGWEVDSLKVDGCFGNSSDFDWMFPALSQELNKTGRPILLECSWPYYIIHDHEKPRQPDYSLVAKHCNYYRVWWDVHDSWASVVDIIDYFAENQDAFSKYHGPGHWFDPDMIVGGNFGLSVREAEAQFALWSMMSAPLLMSNDIRNLELAFKQILLNKHVIAVDQDPLGYYGKRVIQDKIHHSGTDSIIDVWAKKLSGEHYAVLYFNRGNLGNPTWVSHSLEEILKNVLEDYEIDGLSSSYYHASDLHADGKIVTPNLSLKDNLTLLVNPSSVRMVRLIPVS